MNSELPEENTPTYRRGYYEGFMNGMGAAFGVEDYEALPQQVKAFVGRLYLAAIANRDDTSMIERPPTQAPLSEPLPTETRNRADYDLPGYTPHWSDER